MDGLSLIKDAPAADVVAAGFDRSALHEIHRSAQQHFEARFEVDETDQVSYARFELWKSASL